MGREKRRRRKIRFFTTPLPSGYGYDSFFPDVCTLQFRNLFRPCHLVSMLSAYTLLLPFYSSESVDRRMWRGNPKLRTIFVSFPPSPPPPSYEYKSTNIRVEIRDGGLFTSFSRAKHTHTRICRVKYTKHRLHMWNKTWAHIRT